MNSNEIRQQFLDFFRSKEHEIVPSSPVVPHDDPTLMFANAGMNQFKPIFLGTVDRNSAFGRMKRAANTQKCIRAGGKHNDLDDVGQDTYHHTFFEMLGNWSFGDYFKKEAIAWAWELLTEVWGIDKSRLHATYFEGDAADGLEPDSEAAELWRTITDIDPAHIHPGNKKDNFWEMGDTGPCGPCSEIHIDLTPDKSGAHLVNAGDARVMEIWNLVFIQFNRGPDGKLTPLPAKHVDTGMGFERLCAVLQGTGEPRTSVRADSRDSEPQASACADSRTSMTPNDLQHPRELKLAVRGFSNYDTDVFTPIFAAIQKRTGAPDYTATLPNEPRTSVRADSQEISTTIKSEGPRDLKIAARDDVRAASASERSEQSQIDNRKSQIMVDVSYRVIADHIRCLTFALTDGAVPSNEGRGYVLRRILRRAVRYGRQYLNMHEPFLCDLVKPLVDHMGNVFPELRTGPNPKRPFDNVKHVADILRDEEASFLKTLDRGIKLFNEAADHAQRHHHGKISGEDAFKLHDTYGFPIDLTELMAEEQGLTIDIGEYERLMEVARIQARGGDKTVDTGETDPAKREELAREHWTHSRGLTEGKISRNGGTLPVDWRSALSMTPDEHLTAIVNYVLGDDLRRTRIESGDCPDEFKYGQWHAFQSYVTAVGGFSRPTGQFYPGDKLSISTIATCFYAEQGGQVSDRGWILTRDGAEVEITGISKYAQQVNSQLVTIIEHHGILRKGVVRFGDVCLLKVDENRRLPTMQNHTATHLLNWALREVLCPPEEREHPHVQQKGSLVDPEKTRFDFSHNHPLSDKELHDIESLVNERIQAGLRVYTNNNVEVDQAKAREITGLRAVFGEKYPDKVRVVSIGVPVGDKDVTESSDAGAPSVASSLRGSVASSPTLLSDPQNPEWLKFSIEFCGGTHVSNTKEIEAFVLTEESGVAKGVRRLVGVSGKMAKDAIAAGRALLDELYALAGKPPVAPGEPRTSVRAVSPDSEPQASACADSPDSSAPQDSTQPRELKLAARDDVGRAVPADLGSRVAAFQERINKSETPIPIAVRHAIRERLAELQKVIKEQEKASAAESGEAVMDRMGQLLEQAKEPRTSVRAVSPDGGSPSGEGSTCFTIGGVVVVVAEVPPANPDALRGAIDWIRNKTEASAVLLACVDDGKVTLLAGMSKTVVGRGVKAGDLIKEIAPLVGGRGGGRPDMAQGGGTDPSGLNNALKQAAEWIAGKLG